MARVLVVDSDPAGRAELESCLSGAGFSLAEASTASEAAERLRDSAPNAVVLDMFLRDQSGFAVCRAIRENPDAKDVPILVVTRSTSDLDRILALEAGADDVVVRPFFPRELALRVRALLRRADGERSAPEPPLAHGPISLDPGRRSVLADGDAVALTEIEFALLGLLLRRPTHVFTREEILTEIWPDGAARTPRVVDTHVKGIRRKLGSSAWVLESLHGVGYRLAALPEKER
ncbi:MAG TPA: response regulator transcription factor [Myxococcota bacterium]|nr:response regulator transcription factor [Myxococcota bacterium]